MTTKNFEGITHVVYISTHIGTGCEICHAPVGKEHFAESINHYIEKHGYKLLHVGQETGESLQMTVAVLGK